MCEHISIYLDIEYILIYIYTYIGRAGFGVLVKLRICWVFGVFVISIELSPNSSFGAPDLRHCQQI